MSALWDAQSMRAATGGALRVPFTATGVSIDSRTLRGGELFVALVGENGDGHAHVAGALSRGASGAMVHALPDGIDDDAPLLQVADTMVGLGDLGRFARARFTGKLAAITGSVGKTTTKEMLRTILSAQGKTWAAEASYNNHWGVPLTLACLPARAAYCVAEIGMNHAGEIAPLAAMAAPDVAIITNVEAAHIGYLGSLAAIAEEKAAIMAGLVADGIAVLPADSPSLPHLLAHAPAGRTITFGRAETADARLLTVSSTAMGCVVAAAIHGTRLDFTIGAPGAHMAMNAVAALAAAHALGADIVIGAAALAGFSPIVGRGARREIEVAGGTALLLDESYNASGPAVAAALAVLALQPATRRVAVLGDMLEMGEHGPAEHAALAPDVIANADILFTCGPLMRGLFDAVPTSLQGMHAEHSAALAPLVADALRPGDVVLVKGSLGSRMRLVVQAMRSVAT